MKVVHGAVDVSLLEQVVQTGTQLGTGQSTVLLQFVHVHTHLRVAGPTGETVTSWSFSTFLTVRTSGSGELSLLREPGTRPGSGRTESLRLKPTVGCWFWSWTAERKRVDSGSGRFPAWGSRCRTVPRWTGTGRRRPSSPGSASFSVGRGRAQAGGSPLPRWSGAARSAGLSSTSPPEQTSGVRWFPHGHPAQFSYPRHLVRLLFSRIFNVTISGFSNMVI